MMSPADSEIFRYLQSLFESNLDKIREYVDIPADSEEAKEVFDNEIMNDKEKVTP